MPASEQLIQQIIQRIDEAVTGFNKSIPSLQNQINNDLQLLFKELEISGDNLRNSISNLKLLNKLKAKIDDVILREGYLKNVGDFAKSFTDVAQLQNGYFSSLDKKFTPIKVLAEIKKDAVNSTIESLTEAGISANVSEGIQDILRTNITSGAKFSDMVQSMRNYILTNETGLGALEKYTTQITTDSLNQFSATYNQTISADLGYKWRRYVGSNIKTTRSFCLKLTAKEFYHVDELPEILKGHIDGSQVKLNPKSGLWYGAIPGTTKENFAVNRGGYKCGHQDFGVSEVMVPEHIRKRFKG